MKYRKYVRSGLWKGAQSPEKLAYLRAYARRLAKTAKQKKYRRDWAKQYRAAGRDMSLKRWNEKNKRRMRYFAEKLGKRKRKV